MKGKKKMQSRNEDKLANGPIIKTMFQLGIPTFIAQFINLLYNIIDRVYIGHIEGIGAMALTGLGICFPIITLITAFASLVGAGGAPIAGIAFGQGDKNKAEKVLGNGVTLILILSVALTIIFQIIKRPFLFMFGASEATYPYAEQYLTIYLCGTLFVMITMGLNTFIIVQGESTIAMVSVIIGACINIILDPILIFVCHLGVQGAAIASIFSQAVSALWILRFLVSKKASLKIRRANLKLSKEMVLKITALGISPFIMSATESLITVVFNSGALKYGNDLYVGSITILQSALSMIFVPLNGFTQGVSPIISYNYGAKNLDRVKKTCTAIITITGSFCLVLTGIFMLFPRTIAGFFTDNTELLDICTRMLPIFICGMLVFGLQSGCQTCYMALSKAKQALFFALFRKVILLTPLALILPAVSNNILGLYLAEPISDATSAITCFIVFIITLRGVMKEGK